MSYYGFRPYVPVAKRRAIAARELEKLRKKGRKISPVVLEGRSIARTFWGKAWCENLERYSDFENRLPRGRTYVRNGSVVDLQIERGQVRAMVSGSELYTARIDIDTIPKARWEAICRDCLGSVTSLVELLQGKISKNVMERVCREGDGLFPSPREMGKLRCFVPGLGGHVQARVRSPLWRRRAARRGAGLLVRVVRRRSFGVDRRRREESADWANPSCRRTHRR